MRSGRIIDDALNLSGQRHYANDSFREGLDVLVQALDDCKLASTAGRLSLQRQMTGYLANRFAIERYLQEHPALQREPVESPTFVLGMPRTGTTLMVNLLSQDPAVRTLRKWEANFPVPPAKAGELATDPRCIAANEERRAELAAGKLKANIHFEWYDEPTECVYLMAQDFKSTSWDALLPLPAYSEFLLSCDARPMYQWHRRVLQHLQENNRGRWTLKAPGHALFARALLDVYPDARLIWMHRDPREAVASLASLIAGVHRRFAPEPDHEWIRNFYPRQLAEHVNRMLKVERDHPHRVFHVMFDHVDTDAVGTMEKLYADMGIQLTPCMRALLVDWSATHPRHQHGRHDYDLDRFGISPARIETLFADYTDRLRQLRLH
jgi:hypothetical protein